MVTIEERLARLEERIEHIITKVDDITKNHLKNIYDKIERLSSRPSWIVAIIITFLTTLCVGLIVKTRM